MVTWNDLGGAKETFLGDVLAIQLLPPKDSYVNLHPYCLHLFRRLDAETVPDKVWKK